MITVSAQFPADIPHEVIAQTLAYIGGRIVDAAPVRTVQSVRKTAKKQSIDYQDLTVINKETGEVKREIDGVTVAKLIAKMNSARNRFNNSDGRSAGRYWSAHELEQVAKRRPDTYAQEYIRAFCSGLSHVKAEYTNGVQA
jgi:hypothetical protein